MKSHASNLRGCLRSKEPNPFCLRLPRGLRGWTSLIYKVVLLASVLPVLDGLQAIGRGNSDMLPGLETLAFGLVLVLAGIGGYIAVREEENMKITHETRRESFEQLDPSGRKAAILAELERGDGTALEIMRRMGFTDPNRVRPRLNELDRAGYIFQVGKRRDPYTGVEGVIYSKKCPARATNTDKATKKNTLSIKYTERGRLSNGI